MSIVIISLINPLQVDANIERRIIRIEISVTSDNKLKFTKIGNKYYSTGSSTFEYNES